jgi:uncharacterized protein (DUF1684 family)
MKFFFFFALLTFIFLTESDAQTPAEFNRAEYIKSIKKERKEKDTEMKNGERSPVKAEEKANFKKLHYYKPRVSYRKEARFERYDQAMHFMMRTTTDRLPEYSVYGKVTFRHNGNEYTLNVYQNIELVKKPGYEKHLFIPFNDETNGSETYGGGRFLDIHENGEDIIIIDFNKAYNPYCAYNPKYSCPIPPESNNLKIKIPAGEKKWHK